jgi:HEPN domain-containing protein
MLNRSDLRRIARSRLQDAVVLYRGRRYDGAIYLCGYAVELALKARVCRTLRWPGFPVSNKEFEGLLSFKTHNLEVLLRLAGREAIKTTHLADWSVVVSWNPESRYSPPGGATRAAANSMIESTRALMRVI